MYVFCLILYHNTMNDLILINVILSCFSLILNLYETIISKFYVCRSKCFGSTVIEIDVEDIEQNQHVIVIRKSQEFQQRNVTPLRIHELLSNSKIKQASESKQ